MGTLSVGYVPEAYRANLIEMPQASSCSHWTAPLQSVVSPDRGAGNLQNHLPAPVEAIIDSGSDGVVGPPAEIEQLARALGAERTTSDAAHHVNFYTVPCASKDTLPYVELTLGTRERAAKVTLHGDDLVGAPADSPSGEHLCHLRLVGWETESWVLGAAFLQRLNAAIFYPDRQQLALSLGNGF
eukprot:gnl/TRDRNA2_/TRDRNA2_172535_c0_seq1.p2 gnl/TRDRNA2_/TRDRNA2_172535_c0~~gnl/TRDRNA2_/TRDRNA2_172535_c0_seq1.p2  ORF type:complete len:185 (-),score=33.72 gnl/TRDRNA2_/TRDRNA2_172535_c0_seq1:576-1130(-)